MSNYQYGWVCPQCKRTYSPYTNMCLYCNNVSVPMVNGVNISTTGVTIPTTNASISGDFPSEPTARDILHTEGYPTNPMNVI